MKKRYTLTLDSDVVEEVRRKIPIRGLSDFVEQLLEFWLLNSEVRLAAHNDGISNRGGKSGWKSRILSKNSKKPNKNTPVKTV